MYITLFEHNENKNIEWILLTQLRINQYQKNRKNSPPNDYKLAVKQKIKHSENNDEKNKKK